MESKKEILENHLEKSECYFDFKRDCIDGYDAIPTVLKAMEEYAELKSSQSKICFIVREDMQREIVRITNDERYANEIVSESGGNYTVEKIEIFNPEPNKKGEYMGICPNCNQAYSQTHLDTFGGICKKCLA